MLLENVQISLASENSVIQAEHTDAFKKEWDAAVQSGKGKHKLGKPRLNCYEVFDLIQTLREPLGRVEEIDNWKHRFLSLSLSLSLSVSLCICLCDTLSATAGCCLRWASVSKPTVGRRTSRSRTHSWARACCTCRTRAYPTSCSTSGCWTSCNSSKRPLPAFCKVLFSRNSDDDECRSIFGRHSERTQMANTPKFTSTPPS